MPPEALAVIASVCFAGYNIAVRRGVADTSILGGGLLVSLGASVIVTATAYVLSGPQAVPLKAVAAFAMAGLFGPVIGRATGMIGVRLLGPSRASPLQGSLYPVAAIALALLFLGEDLALSQATGALIVALGVWLLLSKKESEEMAVESLPVRNRGIGIPPVVFPIVAGIAFGTGDIFRKSAMDMAPQPIFGALIGTATGLVLWLCASMLVPNIRLRVRLGPGAWWFALSGVLAAAAILSVIAALEHGTVTLVTPIIATQPLAVLILSALFLRRLERLDLRIVLGAVSVVTGTVLISISQ